MARALDEHAEEAYAALTPGPQQAVCEELFKAITDKGNDVRGTRRPTRMDTLVEVTGASADALAAAIEVFREPTRSFLMPPAGTPLAAETPIDISHESLMRVWQRLSGWVEQESQSAQTYRRLSETAELHAAGRAALLRPPDLPFALAWREREQPTEAWARRYRSGFAPAMDFLQRSQKAYDEEVSAELAESAEREHLARQQKRTRRLLVAVSTAGAVLVAMLSTISWLYGDAEKERERANLETARANSAAASSAAAEREARAAQATAEEALRAARRARDSQRKQSEVYAQALNDKPQLRQEIQQAVQNKRTVYLQYADGAQQRAMERLRPQLANAGWSAPPADKVQDAPANAQLRYFRSDDAADARGLADLLKRWGWGVVRPEFVKGYEGQSQVRQFEVWLARSDPAEMARLLRASDAPARDDRLRAVQALVDGHSASPAAIAGALALLAQDRIEQRSTPGRHNLLYFLTRTAPLAWDAPLIAMGAETARRLHERRDLGRESVEELERFDRLRQAAAAGAAAGPAAN
jgi:hypothetical protein